MLVILLVLNQRKTVVHELEPARGDQIACEGLVDKTNYHKADCSELSTLDRFKV